MSRFSVAGALASLLVVGVGPTLQADSSEGGLRIGVEVTRQCAVTTAATVEVRCTRTAGAVVQTTVDGRVAAPTPLTLSGPGVVAASIPLAAGTSSTRVVTVLF